MALASVLALPADLTRALRDEHDTVRRGLAVLERVCCHLDAGGQFPGKDVAEILTFLRDYMEHMHQGREERQLYPTVALLGPEETAELVGILIADHEENRTLLHTLQMFWEPTGELTEEERIGFADTSRVYIRRLLDHFAREERGLFGALQQLPADERMRLAEGAGICARKRDWVRRVARLERAYKRS